MTRDSLSRLVRAGLLTGILDGLFSSVLSAAFYDSTVTRLFQGVAATLLGPAALEGGVSTALIGVLMHFGVAFGWSAVFLFLFLRSAWMRRVLASPYGVFKVAAVYGPFIWLVMSLVVIPVLLQRPPAITYRWWVQLIGHFPFVGLPIVASIASGFRRQEGGVMTRSDVSEDLFEVVRTLIASLRRTGHPEAATELQEGFASLNGLTDGWALFLESIEKVRATHSRRFTPQDRQALDRIRKDVRAIVYRT